jgi:hypothetical protein
MWTRIVGGVQKFRTPSSPQSPGRELSRGKTVRISGSASGGPIRRPSIATMSHHLIVFASHDLLRLVRGALFSAVQRAVRNAFLAFCIGLAGSIGLVLQAGRYQGTQDRRLRRRLT